MIGWFLWGKCHTTQIRIISNVGGGMIMNFLIIRFNRSINAAYYSKPNGQNNISHCPSDIRMLCKSILIIMRQSSMSNHFSIIYSVVIDNVCYCTYDINFFYYISLYIIYSASINLSRIALMNYRMSFDCFALQPLINRYSVFPFLKLNLHSPFCS